MGLLMSVWRGLIVRGSLSVVDDLGAARLYTTATGGALLGDWSVERLTGSLSVSQAFVAGSCLPLRDFKSRK